jgi:hypothetical protein
MATAGSTYLVYGDKMKDLLLGIPKTIDDTMNSLGRKIVDGVRSIPGIVTSAITDVFNSIGKMISDAIGKIKSYIPGLGGGGTQLPRPQGLQGKRLVIMCNTGRLYRHPSIWRLISPSQFKWTGARWSVVTNQMVASATYPTSASGADGRGQWLGPSAYATEQG